jgi:hypothetical protein
LREAQAQQAHKVQVRNEEITEGVREESLNQASQVRGESENDGRSFAEREAKAKLATAPHWTTAERCDNKKMVAAS